MKHFAAQRLANGSRRRFMPAWRGKEARGSQGDTPLRRAVNCVKVELAKLLLDRGADVRSQGSKGRTPWEAARSNAMRVLLKP